ncbi:citrate transporter [Moraxella caviae]|uniref:Citrate transporter n=1 Tax=Moraxella caviae TaxID=34060 RepID=A0A1T0A1M0_9GAMM|nr:GntP family permease [Moraxella caviae]OOR89575.1 citrate transporter [Moraxella caviae]STZ10256.1 H+/gluconate symporter and related permeases [Moraxella caviae]VEW13241.1 H+/gluconate symporter and related permeases [Moraxella caviae]
MLSILPIVLTLFLLMFFAYRGYSVLILAPIMAALAVILTGDWLHSLPAYTDVFMTALSNFLLKFFPVFLLGALFGKLMADSGAATSIAHFVVNKLGGERAVLAVVLICALLTYGGVSLFVVAFAIYPIAKNLFYQADIPKRLIPAAIALGSFTFTMTALPGSPAIQNAIPIPYYSTNVFAAPILGLIGGAIMFVGGVCWLNRCVQRAKICGEGYGKHSDDTLEQIKPTHNIPFIMAITPLVLVVLINALLIYFVFPRMDFSALDSTFPALNIGSSLGLWSLIIAMLAACLSAMIIHLKSQSNLKHTINQGATDSMLPIFNTASEVGYGAVIASLAGFALIRDGVLNLSPSNPLISEAVAMTTLAGITGSSSGGLSIALSTLGDEYLEMALAAGISPELMHRVATMAAGGLDTLPHSGAVITLLAICKLTHKTSYLNVAAVTIVIPLIATATVIALGTMFGSF